MARMLTKRKQKIHVEILRLFNYSLVGGAWFWSGYATFAVCYSWLGLSLWWAKLAANVVGLSVNFVLERIWVFHDQKRHKRLTVVTERYLILTLINFVIDYFIIRILKDQFGLTPYIGQFISAGFFYGWNYAWYRYWVFARVRTTKKALA